MYILVGGQKVALKQGNQTGFPESEIKRNQKGGKRFSTEKEKNRLEMGGGVRVCRRKGDECFKGWKLDRGSITTIMGLF